MRRGQREERGERRGDQRDRYMNVCGRKVKYSESLLGTYLGSCVNIGSKVGSLFDSQQSVELLEG